MEDRINFYTFFKISDILQSTEFCPKHAAHFSNGPNGDDIPLVAPKTYNKPTAKAVTISRAMRAYMEQAKAYGKDHRTLDHQTIISNNYKVSLYEIEKLVLGN